jgi:dGTP triphosphohydrolase
MEGRVVRFADKIAYMNHDIEDAVRAGLFRINDVPWRFNTHSGAQSPSASPRL